MPLENIKIRVASMSDMPILLQFEQGVISAERPMDSTLQAENVKYYNLVKMISSPDTQILVATINDALVGSGYARIESGKIYNTFEKYAYLGFMFVKSDYRGLGINAKIIENLKNWCLSRDIFELRLDVYHNNPSAIKAYQKVGFESNMINMRIDIRP